MLSQPTRGRRSGRRPTGTRPATTTSSSGRVGAEPAASLTIEFELVNVLTGQRLGGQRISGDRGDAAQRRASGRGLVYEKIIGVRGAFATRIAYVVGRRRSRRRSATS